MGNEETEIKSILLSLERSLLDNTVRTDGHRLSEVVYFFTKEQLAQIQNMMYEKRLLKSQRKGDFHGKIKHPVDKLR